MSIRMVIKTCLLALNHVWTCGEDSIENLRNTIKNLKALDEALAEAEKRSDNSDDGDDQ